MLESRYIPSKRITRAQAASQGQRKTEDVVSEEGRDETSVLLRSLGAVSQCLTEVLHQHQGLVKLPGLQRNLLDLRAAAYKPLAGAGAVSDRLGFGGGVREQGILLLGHVGSTGCSKDIPAYIRNVNCRCLVSNWI